MFIEQLDKNKIKVVVEAAEQEEFGVTYESMTYSDRNTRRLCESIMERAKSEVGFNLCGAKLLVEARQGSNGSVTLYLSKLTVAETERDELFGQTIIFDTFDSLCDCRTVFTEYADKMTAADVYLIDHKYCLYFELIGKRNQAAALFRSLLEFGERSRLSRELLEEHGEKLCFELYRL